MADSSTKDGFTLDIRLRLSRGGGVVFGKGVCRLLVLCERHHSLHMAAKEMQMSYRKALFVVHRAEAGFGRPLLEKTIGGAGGGGSRLTDFGRQMVENFEKLEEEVALFARQKLAEKLPDIPLEE